MGAVLQPVAGDKLRELTVCGVDSFSGKDVPDRGMPLAHEPCRSKEIRVVLDGVIPAEQAYDKRVLGNAQLTPYVPARLRRRPEYLRIKSIGQHHTLVGAVAVLLVLECARHRVVDYLVRQEREFCAEPDEEGRKPLAARCESTPDTPQDGRSIIPEHAGRSRGNIAVVEPALNDVGS